MRRQQIPPERLSRRRQRAGFVVSRRDIRFIVIHRNDDLCGRRRVQGSTFGIGPGVKTIRKSLPIVGTSVRLHAHELTMATASISIMKSGPARRVTPTVVLVGVATPK